MMMISDVGVNLIKDFEGCYLTAYRCPAGVLTIGYGTTEAIDGKPITEGMTITQKQADELLVKNLKTYEKAVNDYVKVNLNQNQFDALVSFTYNVGCNALKTSTLLQLLNEGDYKEASEQFERWKYAGGKVLNGLIRRRKAEKELFLKPYDNDIKKEDTELVTAVNKIISNGITLDVNVWNDIDNINLNNVPALIIKLGINALAELGIISNVPTWTDSKYTKNDVRTLIIKYANSIS